MKKIYLLIPVFALSLFIVGCSSGSSEDTTKTTTTKKTTPTEDKNKSCETGLSFDANGECVLDNNITDLICTDNQIIVDGKCQDKEIEVPTCQDNQVLNADTNQCETVSTVPTCEIGKILSDDNTTCITDETVTALTSGTVRDGLISGSTISICKIVDGNKSEANVTCSKTDSKGEFKCAIYEKDYTSLIFKAIGGIDLGENINDSRDDRNNQDTLRTFLSKSDIENNTSSFISPATNLVVLKASNTEWNFAQAKTDIEKSLGVSSVLENSKSGIESARIVANIIDSLGSDVNRTSVFVTLSKEETIFTKESGVQTGLLTKLNTKIVANIETILNAQIVKSVNNPSDIIEKLIDVISKRVDDNKTVTEIIANNFENTFTNSFSTSENILDLVAEIPTEKDVSELKIVTDKISEILGGVEDSDKATDFLKEELAKDSDIADLSIDDVKSKIGEKICPDGKELTNGICKDIPEVTIKPVMKDAVNSPDDIPAIPNDSARTFEESKFPTIPKDNEYANREDDNLTKMENPSDSDYPKIDMTSGDNNQTTPYSN